MPKSSLSGHWALATIVPGMTLTDVRNVRLRAAPVCRFICERRRRAHMPLGNAPDRYRGFGEFWLSRRYVDRRCLWDQHFRKYNRRYRSYVLFDLSFPTSIILQG